MKKITLLIALVVSIATLSAQTERDVENFTGLKVMSAFNVELQQGQSGHVSSVHGAGR